MYLSNGEQSAARLQKGGGLESARQDLEVLIQGQWCTSDGHVLIHSDEGVDVCKKGIAPAGTESIFPLRAFETGRRALRTPSSGVHWGDLGLGI